MSNVESILIGRVRVLLRDVELGGTQWRDPELIEWFNEACAEVCRVRPEASSAYVRVPLVAGATQAITGASRVLEVVCNSPSDGVEGRALRITRRSTLDNEDPNWMVGTPSATVSRYAVSKANPRMFYVFPPSDGTGGVMAILATPPTPVAALEDAFPLPSIYEAMVANYVLFRAFGKMTESEAMQAKSRHYYDLYLSQIRDTGESMETNNAETRDL